jgi:putative membrane protein
MALGIEVRPRERAVALFTFAYVAAFSAWFILGGNYEFVVYLVSMLLLIFLVGRSLRSAEYPPAMLWALSLWGLMHMAGGGVPVGDAVLYNLQVIPLGPADGEWTFLKYDQLVHAYGFGVTAWVLWHLMARHYPVLEGTRTIYVYPALAAMGLGAVNEIIEFIAVLSVPDTNVGGYLNTALDLVFNAAGAIIAMVLVALTRRKSAVRG